MVLNERKLDSVRVQFCIGQRIGPGGVRDYASSLSEMIARNCPSIVFEQAIGVPATSSLGEGDLFSLQYVPYGFQEKGIPITLPRVLARLQLQCPTHIFFHEVAVNPIGRLRIVRAFQLIIAKRLVQTLKPILVQTSNDVYAKMLASLGIEARILPVFSTIPLDENFVRLSTQGASIRIACFGNPPTGIALDVWLNQLSQELKATTMSSRILAIGRIHSNLLDELSSKVSPFSPQIELEIVGEMDPDGISKLLFGCDAGITGTRSDLLGKGTGAQAIIEHGLPLFAPNSSGEASFHGDQIMVGSGSGSIIQHSRKKFQPYNGGPKIAHLFLQDLGRAGHFQIESLVSTQWAS